MAENKPQVRVASIEVELGMSVQNKAGIWCKPTARMNLTIDGGTSPAQRAAIIKQGFDEVCENIEKEAYFLLMMLRSSVRRSALRRKSTQ